MKAISWEEAEISNEELKANQSKQYWLLAAMTLLYPLIVSLLPLAVSYQEESLSRRLVVSLVAFLCGLSFIAFKPRYTLRVWICVFAVAILHFDIFYVAASMANEPIYLVVAFLVYQMTVALGFEEVSPFLVSSTLGILFMLLLTMPVASVTPKMSIVLVFSTSFTANILVHYSRFAMAKRLRELNLMIRRQSEELEQHRIKSYNASRLASLGEVSGEISNDVKNPISIIQGYVLRLKDLSRKGTLTSQEIFDYSEKVIRAVQRISRLILGLKKYSRESDGTLKSPIVLNTVVSETVDLTRERYMGYGVTLEVGEAQREFVVVADEIHIFQVMISLLNNAFYELKRQMDVSGIERSSPWIRIDMVDCGEQVRVEVSNSGKVMDEEVRQNLFQPFFTTKPLGQGTGLGLAISRKIIEDHGGALFLVEDSEYTKFAIQLNIAPEGVQKVGG